MSNEWNLETTNGAWRAVDGRFYELPDRRFYPSERDPELLRGLVRLARLTLLHAGDGSPTAALNAVRALRRRLDDMEREAVILARANGWSWRDVGEVLGVSGSTAHQRFARADVPPRRRRRS